MIWVIDYAELESHLRSLGFSMIDRTEQTVLYFSREHGYLTIPSPVIEGAIPETIATNALDNAGLPVPDWDVGFSQ